MMRGIKHYAKEPHDTNCLLPLLLELPEVTKTMTLPAELKSIN
mgnify:CR=1 FL=1